MDFLSSVNSLGTVPMLVLITVIFILLVREVKKENEDLSRSFDRHRQDVDKALEEYRAGCERVADAQNKAIAEYKLSTDRQIASQNSAIRKMEERLAAVEKNYAERTYVQEVVSGWRSEIRRLDDKLTEVLMKRNVQE